MAVAAGLATLRNADDAVYAAAGPHAAHDRPAGLGRADRRRAWRTSCSTPATCSRSSSPTAPVTNFAQAQASRDVPVRPVLPRHARRRGVPAAERVRGLVRHRRARRRRDRRASPTRCRPPPGPPPAAASRGMSASRDHRPPAAPRRGVQPRQGPVRPAARLPAVRGRRRDGRAGRRARWPAATSATWSPRRCSGRRRPPRRWPPQFGLEIVRRRPADRGRPTPSRASGSVGPGGVLKHPRAGRCSATRSGRPGVSRTPQIAQRMLAAALSARDRAEGREAVCVSHQLPIVCLRRYAEGQRLWHDPRKRQCSLASLTSLTFDGDTWSGSTTPSRPAPSANLISRAAARRLTSCRRPGHSAVLRNRGRSAMCRQRTLHTGRRDARKRARPSGGRPAGAACCWSATVLTGLQRRQGRRGPERQQRVPLRRRPTRRAR